MYLCIDFGWNILSWHFLECLLMSKLNKDLSFTMHRFTVKRHAQLFFHGDHLFFAYDVSDFSLISLIRLAKFPCILIYCPSMQVFKGWPFLLPKRTVNRQYMLTLVSLIDGPPSINFREFSFPPPVAY